MSSEGKLGNLLISAASYFPSMSPPSPVLNVLQSLSHWLLNSTASSYLKLSSTQILALTSLSVSNLSFKDQMVASTTTLKNAVSSLFMSSSIGSV
jgi:hypothetical protein